MKSWEEAEQKYPRFANEAALERFVSAPKLAGPILAAFQQFCSRAIRAATASQLDSSEGTQSVQLSVDGGSYHGVHLAMAPEDSRPSCHSFQGFHSLLRLTGRSDLEVSFNSQQTASRAFLCITLAN